MANLSFTLTQLTNAVLHATGKSAGLDTGNNVTDLVNQAVSYLATFSNWTWRYKVLSLDFVASQAYVALPSDFGELSILRGGSTTRRNLIPVSLDRILLMRQSLASSSNGTKETYYAITSTPQIGVTALPTLRLELYPTPSASESGAAVGMYLRDIPTLSGGTDVPDIDTAFMPCLLKLCRGLGKMYETPDQANPEWELAHKELANLKIRDGMKQGSVVGRLIGTTQMIDSNSWDGWSRFSTDSPISV